MSHPIHKCCGQDMSYVDVDGEKITDTNDHYFSKDDSWFCESCGDSKESYVYKDWFGSDDLEIEIYEYLETKSPEKPLVVMKEGYMACVVWEDSIVVFGYDGNEYCHSFGFDLNKVGFTGLLKKFKVNPPTLILKEKI